MNNIIIEIKGLGKKYNITHQRGSYTALRDVIMNTIKSPFSFLKRRAKKIIGLEKKEEFWALKDINFNVEKGEVVGIIGANGAGKSTLLKILSQITPPTEGEIKIHGRVGSLLEVGTGFHPELTGRENVFLNGAILGMTGKEIAKKFDEIVAFAGIEKFLDTPVKHYSSGMYVRLAFSVAAHMEPDILIVDEVLAVGDAEFQKKCLGKMNEITKKEGRTILFVSHNMSAIATLCQKGILLSHGKIVKAGNIEDVINAYSKTVLDNPTVSITTNKKMLAAITKISLNNNENKEAQSFDIQEEVHIVTEYKVDEPLLQLQLSLTLSNDAFDIVQSFDTDREEEIKTAETGTYRATCIIPKMFLKAGTYNIRATLGIPSKLIQNTGPVIAFDVTESSINTQHKSYRKDRSGLIVSNATWTKQKIS